MYSRNLFVLDFVRRFFVSCAQISEAYTVCTLMKFGWNWQKIGHKSKCRKDSKSTLFQQIQKRIIKRLILLHDKRQLLFRCAQLVKQPTHTHLFTA